MLRRAVGLSVIVTFLVLTSGFGQQLNPFTAVLKTDIERQPVKPGRNRVMLKNASQTSSIPSTTAESGRENTRKPTTRKGSSRPEKVKRPSTDVAASTEKTAPDTDAVTLVAEDEKFDLRRQIGVKYQILTEKNGELHQDDPNRVYHSGEAFRLKIESNINANLYLLAEDARTGERQLLFPNYKFQRGVERVKPFTPVVVPPLGQPAFVFDNRPGEERIVVICSRDEIPALQLAPVESIPEALKAVGAPSLPSDIEQVIGRQGDRLGSRDFIFVEEQKSSKGNSQNVGVYVVNTSKKDNEEVVYVIRIKHGD